MSDEERLGQQLAELFSQLASGGGRGRGAPLLPASFSNALRARQMSQGARMLQALESDEESSQRSVLSDMLSMLSMGGMGVLFMDDSQSSAILQRLLQLQKTASPEDLDQGTQDLSIEDKIAALLDDGSLFDDGTSAGESSVRSFTAGSGTDDFDFDDDDVDNLL